MDYNRKSIERRKLKRKMPSLILSQAVRAEFTRKKVKASLPYCIYAFFPQKHFQKGRKRQIRILRMKAKCTLKGQSLTKFQTKLLLPKEFLLGM